MGDELGYGAVQGHSRVDGLVVVADVESWLLDSDPALRWQVECDVSGDPPSVWEATRARIAKKGSARGCSPCRIPTVGGQAAPSFPPVRLRRRRRRKANPGRRRRGRSTTCGSGDSTPAVLRERRTAELLADNARWEYDDLPYWGGEVDCCINAWTVANGVWLGVDITGIVDWFLDHRLPDGGWNCEWVDGSRRSSFHSTLNSLKGFSPMTPPPAEPRRRAPPDRAGRISPGAAAVPPLIDRATGGAVGAHFGHPFRWKYNVLNAADYFRGGVAFRRHSAGPADGQAIEFIRAANSPTAPGSRQGGRRAGCGSKPMSQKVSRRSG